MFLLEAMDKSASTLDIVIPTFAALAGFVACRKFPTLVVVAEPISIAVAWFVTSEMRDRYVGPALWNESAVYCSAVIGAAVIALVMPLIGGVLGAVHRRRANRDAR